MDIYLLVNMFMTRCSDKRDEIDMEKRINVYISLYK